MIEAEKVQSFKDPGGCVALRMLLEDFEKNIKKLSFEKETQYKKMKQSLQIMEDIDFDQSKKLKSDEVKIKEILSNIDQFRIA